MSETALRLSRPAEAPSEPNPHFAVLQMLAGRWVSQAICSAVGLGLIQHLALEPLSCDELARRRGVHGPSLRRLLRALESLRLVRKDIEGRWHLAEFGTPVAGGHLPMSALARFLGTPEHDAAWGALDYSVRTGGNAFEHVNEATLFEVLSRNEALRDDFHGAMVAIGSLMYGTLAHDYDFERHRLLVDVGGSLGHVIVPILEAAPSLRAIVYDRPEVMPRAREYVSAAGMSLRCLCLAGDFFAEIPQGGDAYLLAGILHEWDDDEAARILRNVRSAMAPDAVLLIGEHVLDSGSAGTFGPLLDLEMLVISPGGRERTRDEFERLLLYGGFSLREILALPSGASLIVGDPLT